MRTTTRPPRSRISPTAIPAAPLLAYIDERGGTANLNEILGLGVLERMPEGTLGKWHTRDLTRQEHATSEKVRRMLSHANTVGRIDLYTADALCCDMLGVHPMEIWGLDWFDFHPDEPVRMSELRVPGEPRVLGVAA